MNSQNTPVHFRLWHRDFWLMAVANLLLTMSVYMLVPVMPRWLLAEQGFNDLQTGLAMGAFGLGLFTFGGFVSFLVQHYRRNQVCLLSVLVMAGLQGVLYYFDTEFCQFVEVSLIVLQRFFLGAFFGLAQMVLASTLIIDTCESYQRTEANHCASWFGRFALSLGPLAGLLLDHFINFDAVLLAAMGCALVSLLMISFVHFPFRAPQDDIPTVSLDRFFLPHGFPLFLNLQLITIAVGILFSCLVVRGEGFLDKPSGIAERVVSVQFFSMMMVGFFGAIIAQRFVFRDAEVKSEVVSGLILIIAALLMFLTRTQHIVYYAAPAFIGCGIGLIGSRFLIFFIKLSRHCQRGTSQSTFMRGWESGIAWGLGIGLGLFAGSPHQALITSLALTIASLVMYNYTHNWFSRNKNR